MKNIIILGPTAIGKTELAIKLSRIIGWPIANCDACQFWKDIPLLSCSPTAEEKTQAEHLLFNVLPSNIRPSLGWWAKEVTKIPGAKIIVGGTAFYPFNLLRGIPDITISEQVKSQVKLISNKLDYLNSLVKHSINPNDNYRIERRLEFILESGCNNFDEYKNQIQEEGYVFIIGASEDFIRSRVKKRINMNISNWLLEVQSHQHENFQNIIGYQPCLDFLHNKINSAELSSQIELHTMQYAKRQVKFLYQFNQAYRLDVSKENILDFILQTTQIEPQYKI